MRNYRKYSLILWLTFNFQLKAQVNLIQNGSFEEIDSCLVDNSFSPINSSIQLAFGWEDALGPSVTLGSSDLFNVCFMF